MIALFVHADPVVKAAYERALGCRVYFANRKGMSAAYDELSGLARDYPTLDAAVKFFAKDAPADSQVVLIAFSAGNWAARAWLRNQDARRRCIAVVLIDGLHANSTGPISGVIDYAMEAMSGRKVLVVTHSQIVPPYTPCKDTVDTLLRAVHIVRAHQLEDVHEQGLHVLAGEGADGKAHVKQLRVVGPEACAKFISPPLVRSSPPAPSDTEPQLAAFDPSKPLRERVLAWCLGEAKRYGTSPVPTARVAEYLAGCERGGKRLGLRPPANFCAAARGFAEGEVALAGESQPPWRAAAKEVMRDAQEGRRGRWVPGSEAEAGYRPPPGSAVIYWRDDPSSWTGHIETLIEAREDGYLSVGANELGGRWHVDPAPIP
ncbi:MAG TPA: hypothetical protein VK524_03225, partial [Polyangiaceae bacterium]|nr:hypothetical protein [Polyangiaceae bacterium]